MQEVLDCNDFVLIQHEKEKSKVTRDMEEKLVVSAWYNLVSSCILS